MTNGLDTSWHADMRAGRKAEASKRTFKSVLTSRLLMAIFGIVLLGTSLVILPLIWLPKSMALAAMIFGVASLIAGIVALRFYIMPRWCSQEETITFLEDGFESKLHGPVHCRDITSYALSTLFGSDKSIRIVTRDKTIQYNIGPGDDSTYPWLAAQVQKMIAGFNVEAAKAPYPSSSEVDERGAAMSPSTTPQQYTAPAIRENSFFKSAGAGVLVAVGCLVSILLFFAPSSGSSNLGMAVMLFGGSMSMLGLIIKARKQP